VRHVSDDGRAGGASGAETPQVEITPRRSALRSADLLKSLSDDGRSQDSALGRAAWITRAAQGAARRGTRPLRADPRKSHPRKDAAAGASGSAVRLAALHVGVDRPN